MAHSRRDFLRQMVLLSAGSLTLPGLSFMNFCEHQDPDLFFDISLAEWSLHQPLFDGELTHMEFPAVAKNEFGIDAVEYVNQFFMDKANDKNYLKELNKRCRDLDVEQLLIMIDGEGDLAVTSEVNRSNAIENHYKWIETAAYLGCHSVRVNLFGDGSQEEQKAASVHSLSKLSEFAADRDINVLVENHGGYSSDASWLVDVMEQVNMGNCGTLPDFGNFCVKREGDARWEAPCVEKYDRYKGVRQLMPYAKGVSAKSYGFNEKGEEQSIDFQQMLTIISDAGFSGHIGIEYEGEELPPAAGIRATKELLIRLGHKS